MLDLFLLLLMSAFVIVLCISSQSIGKQNQIIRMEEHQREAEWGLIFRDRDKLKYEERLIYEKAKHMLMQENNLLDKNGQWDALKIERHAIYAAHNQFDGPWNGKLIDRREFFRLRDLLRERGLITNEPIS